MSEQARQNPAADVQWAEKYLPPWIEAGNISATRAAGYYLSPRLRDNPAAALDTRTELSEFVGQWPEARLRAAQEAHAEMQEVRQLPVRQLRVAAGVPFAHNEHPHIVQRTLAAYARQGMQPRAWLLHAFVNRPQLVAESGRGEAWAALRGNPHAQLPLFTSYQVYESAPPMGLVRADAFDPILYHMALHGINHRVMLLSNDGDPANMSRGYVAGLSQAAQNHPDKEFYTCKMLWEQPGGMHTSMSRAIRYFSSMDSFLRVATPHASVSEANMGIDAATYAAIGGFLQDRPTEQMAQLRHTFALARTGNSQDGAQWREAFRGSTKFVRGIYLRTASRRLQLAFAQGFGPHEAWGAAAVPFSTGQDAMDRSRLPASFPTEITAAVLEKVLGGIDTLYSTHITPYTGKERFDTFRDMARRLIDLPAA